MSKYVRWIEYKGKKILFGNYAGLKSDEMLEAMEAYRQEVLKLPEGSTYLSLMDISNVKMTPEMTAKGRETSNLSKEKRLSDKTACVGMTALQTSVARLVQPNVHFAKDIEEAKEWLVAKKE